MSPFNHSCYNHLHLGIKKNIIQFSVKKTNYLQVKFPRYLSNSLLLSGYTSKSTWRTNQEMQICKVTSLTLQSM